MAKALALTAIVATIVTVAFAMIVGSAIISKTESVTTGMNLSTDAQATLQSMYSTIWASFPLLPLVVLVLVGGAIISALAFFYRG